MNDPNILFYLAAALAVASGIAPLVMLWRLHKRRYAERQREAAAWAERKRAHYPLGSPRHPEAP